MMMEDLWFFILEWLAVVGGFALLLVTLRLMLWLVDVILLTGW
jgi:hypothetical protein